MCHQVWAYNNIAYVNDSVQVKTSFVDTVIKNESLSDSLPLLYKAIQKDSVGIIDDSINLGSSVVSIPISTDSFDAEIHYTARDSMVYDIGNKIVHLYGEAKTAYQGIELTGDYILYNWSSNTLTAEASKNEKDEYIDYAVFVESGESFKARKFSYNFKSKKGKAYEVIKDMSMQDQIYVHGETVKKNEYNEWYGHKGKFTTCELEHPHYYIQAKKMKMVPDKVVVTGPANFVIAGVPTPLILPFGLFPIKEGQRSGLVIGEFAQDSRNNRGFGFKDWGYFFGISDYINLKLTTDIYFNGTFALKAISQYSKKYKYDGNFNLEFGRIRNGEPEDPNFSVSNQFKIGWQYKQNAKAGRHGRFTARVNIATAGYDKSFSTNGNLIYNNSVNSKINYAKSWAGKPYSLSVNMDFDQNFVTRKTTLTPNVNFVMSRIQPFESKKRIGGKKRWYESIGMGYTFVARSRISAPDSTFFSKKTFETAQYGIGHTIPISASFKVFKFFTLNPGINYNGKWYVQTINKTWDSDTLFNENPTDPTVIDTTFGRVVIDTVSGFKTARDFNFKLDLTTKIYGQINFKSKKIKAIRHVFTPTLRFNFRPDFGTDFWGYYKTVQTNASGRTEQYSIFEGAILGSPRSGMVGSIGLNFNNRLEMKVFSKKDTLLNEKNIKLLESFNIGSNYNIAADSLNFSPIRINGRTSLYKQFLTLDFGFILDPYAVNIEGIRINKSVLSDGGGLTRLTNATVSLSSKFRSKKANPPKATDLKTGTLQERELIDQGRLNQQYYDFNIPWDIGLSYRLGMTRQREKFDEETNPNPEDKIVVSFHTFNVNLGLTMTEKWILTFSSGYDFNNLDFTYTQLGVIRNLHCWQMSFRFVPYPINLRSYEFQVNLKSALLQQLKLGQRDNAVTTVF